jgi:phosphoenolpyruvate synthase/pyruvate phosphate dikinase
MQQASAIVTDKGGRTCHAAIVSRELGVPCVVGTGNATAKIAVKTLIRSVIKVAKAKHTKIGLCGQAPSDYPQFARFLVECGIDSISLAPDAIVKTTIDIAKTEAKLAHR